MYILSYITPLQRFFFFLGEQFVPPLNVTELHH